MDRLPGSWSNLAMTIAAIAPRILAVARRFWSKLAPLPAHVEPLQVVADIYCRSRRELVVENATLRHQLNVLRRGAGRPRLGLGDRLRLLLAAALPPAWRKAIVLVQPETILRWQRAGYRLFWRHRSKSRNRPRLSLETIELIRDMAKRGRPWGAERIRGELLKVASGSASALSRSTCSEFEPSVVAKAGPPSWQTVPTARGRAISSRPTTSCSRRCRHHEAHRCQTGPRRATSRLPEGSMTAG